MSYADRYAQWERDHSSGYTLDSLTSLRWAEPGGEPNDPVANLLVHALETMRLVEQKLSEEKS